MKHYVLSFSLLLFVVVKAFSQDYNKDFGDRFNANDTAGMHTTLADWKHAKPNDPELYTSYFNYFVVKARSSVMRLDETHGKNKSLEIRDSANQVVGHMYGESSYDPIYLKKGLAVIEEGIAKFPNRLDMRFGKIYMLGEAKDFDSFTSEIVRTVEYSKTNNSKWLWTNDKPSKSSGEAFFEEIQTYINQLFDIGDPQAKNIRRVAEAILKIEPNNIVSLSNLGISYIFENNYTKALEPLMQAEKHAPSDAIVLVNIAYVYRNLQDYKKAIEYYEKIVKYDQGQAKAFAEGQIKELKLLVK